MNRCRPKEKQWESGLWEVDDKGTHAPQQMYILRVRSNGGGEREIQISYNFKYQMNNDYYKCGEITQDD